MDTPVLKVEVYKRNETDDLGGYSLTPVDISNVFSSDIRAGIETTKDTFTLRIPNNLILSTGSFDLQADKNTRITTDLKIGDMTKIYAYYAETGSSANSDDDLIMCGVINSFSHTNTEDDNYVVFKGVNRSEQLLQGYALGTFDITSNENTSPKIINYIIKRLRAYGVQTYDRRIYSALDTGYIYDPEMGVSSSIAPTGITGSVGNVASTTSTGGSFKQITYKKIWQPTYKIIEELSRVEQTGDEDAGAYISYIKNSTILPEFQSKLRTTTINELVWKPVSKTTAGSLVRGVDYTSITSSKDMFDVKNILIIKAGHDLEGDGISTFAINTESVGKNGARFGYLPLPNIVDKIISEEKRVTGSESPIGSEWATTGYPEAVLAGSSWIFATLQGRSTKYPYDMTGSACVADSKKEFNKIIKLEAKAQGRETGQKLVDTLGSPRFKAKVELVRGSVGSYNMGDLVEVIDPSVGWWGTNNDPGKKLRIHDVQHNFGNEWATTLVLEEDEESVKSKYPTQ